MLIGGKYRLLTQIGQGGTAKVYLAEDLRLRKKWAVKRVQGSAEIVRQEAEILKRLKHPALPVLVDLIEEDDVFYLVMEYVPGKNLAQLLKQGRRFSKKELLHIGIALAGVLEYLHGRKPPVLYRDMKPDNVLLSEDGSVHLVDFGISWLMASGYQAAAAGTKNYAPKEQFFRKPHYSDDLYALGATLQKLTGSQKFPALRRISELCFHQKELTAREVRKKLENELQKRKLCYRLVKAVGVAVLVILLAVLTAGALRQQEMRQYLTVLEQARSYAEQQNEEAAKLYEKAISIQPEKIQPYLELLDFEVYRANTKSGIEKTETLADFYEPKEAELLYRKTGMLYLLGNFLDSEFSVSYEKAEEFLQKSGTEANGLLKLTRELEKFSREINWQEVNQLLEKTEVQAGSVEKQRIVAEIRIRYEKELKSYEPDSLLRGIAILQSVAERAEPREQAEIYMQLAQACYQKGSKQGGERTWLKEALNAYEELEHLPLSMQTKRKIYRGKAAVYFLQEDKEAAAEEYRKWVRQYPKDLEARCGYISLLLECEDRETAKVQLEETGAIPGAQQNGNYRKLKERVEKWL